MVDADDNASYLALDPSVKMELADEAVMIVSDSYDFKVEMSDLKSFQYVSYDLSSVTEASRPSPLIKIGRQEITIYGGCEVGYVCRVYEPGGVCVSEFKCLGEYSINLGDFRKGVYVLNVENATSVKFVVK